MTKTLTILPAVIQHRQNEILQQWKSDLADVPLSKRGYATTDEFHDQAQELIGLLAQAIQSGEDYPAGEGWNAINSFLDHLSRTRVLQGFTSDETASFVFSLKAPIFRVLRADAKGDSDALADAVWDATKLLDALGLRTVGAYQQTREEVIRRQQNDLLELSTPVVSLWEGILGLPIIGTLDSARTQVVMESLLQKIVETRADMAIIDITGVPTVDTLVAQHLLKTVTAIRLMGADCIISGVRPQIAQTIVHLGVDLEGVTTKSTMADALTLALKRAGFKFVKGA